MNFKEGVDKWVVMWEHDYNEKETLMKSTLGEKSLHNLVSKLNPRDT